MEANDAMMALLIGSRLGRHTLALAEGSPHLLGSLFPSVPEVGRLNRSVEDARQLIDDAERHLAYMAIPYVLAVYGSLLTDGIAMLRQAADGAQPDDPRDIPLSELHTRFVAEAGAELEDLPAVHLHLFEFARWVRNRIVHRGATPGSRLANHYRQVLSDADRAEWTRIAHRDPLLRTPDEKMDLRSPELRAVLAVTKHLAERINGILCARLPRSAWAEIVVADYEDVAQRRSQGKLRAVAGFSRMYYSPLKLEEPEIEEAIRAAARKGGRSTD